MKDWYEGYLNYGNDFKVCINKIITKDNFRYRDWTLWPLNNNKFDQYLTRVGNVFCLTIDNLSRYMYISGAYWVAKKEIYDQIIR